MSSALANLLCLPPECAPAAACYYGRRSRLASLDSAFVHRQEKFLAGLAHHHEAGPVVTGGNHIDHGQCGHLSGST